MGLGRAVKRFFGRRRLRWGKVIMADIERDLAAALQSNTAKLLALKVSPRLDGLVAANLLTAGAKAEVVAALSLELAEAAPRWADDMTDRLRRLLRLPDDD